ncbi:MULTISPECIES: amino acid ABC transporter permease [unclassified Motilimonas]|uniref:amino acid ABC transporter permease n=1 Tax=unclassified Motilimonas TaxID=2643697 RepID=UPI001E57DE1C|nr:MULTISPECIES: amino acid ABC transporter permease [unclassified Motilimonas]MCE0555412.1 amino acid ABC transporter permease [Motilimonas sp. E26]MDO6527639.1 amino acid ABC transporter permease [Motilimonas sp. 1_MG-2023]
MSNPPSAPTNSVSFFNNPKNRAIIFQVFALGLVVFLAYYFANNMFANIEARGIETGFSFLDQVAGFGISQTLVEYDDGSSTYSRVFLVGILNTLLVSGIAIFFTTILGLLIGIGRLSSNFLIAKLSMVYVETFRNIPILLQILFWYNVVLAALPSPRQSLSYFGEYFLNNRGFLMPKPILEDNSGYILAAFIIACIGVYFLARWAIKRHDDTGEEFPIFSVGGAIIILAPVLVYFIAGQPISSEVPELKGFNFKGGWVIIPELLALAFALSIYTATYIAEAVRAGIESVPKGQKEAANSLGLKEHVILRKVILPQALRVIIPPVINQYLNLVKNSSLATAIGYPEIVTLFSGTTLNQVGQAIEIILMTMAVYLLFSIVISLLLNWVNAKMEIKGR